MKQTLENIFGDHPSSHTEIKDYVRAFLDMDSAPKFVKSGKKLTYIDLFCGGGGLSLGVNYGLNKLGYDPRLLFAADIDQSALSLVKHHFKPFVCSHQSIEDLIEYSVDLSGGSPDFVTQPYIRNDQISQFRGKVDLLVGGPPCQGHSNLNNKTRRQDPRNLLYFTMPAVAVALKIPTLIIENVKSIQNASEEVVPITKKILTTHGYYVEERIVCGTDFGVAQTRERHFLVASQNTKPNLDWVCKHLSTPTLSFDDVNNNVPMLNSSPDFFNTPAQLSAENQSRIEHLHKTGTYNLDNKMRPVCHQNGHTYPSVYGRLDGAKPSGTITTGFGSPGRGRYIHPHEPRMITIREAARLQSFPDWYFANIDHLKLKRNHLYKIIGDAVPSLMVLPLIAALAESFKEKKQRIS